MSENARGSEESLLSFGERMRRNNRRLLALEVIYRIQAGESLDLHDDLILLWETASGLSITLEEPKP